MAKTGSGFGAAQAGRRQAKWSGLRGGSDTEPGKVIRDSFTMPHADYELIGVLKQRCLGLGVAMKKSELLRAGLAALHGLPDVALVQVVAAVESVKTGRPPGRKRKKRGKKKKKKTNRAKGKKR